MIYGALLGIGEIVMEDYGVGAACLAGAAVAGIFIYRDLTRRGWSSIME